MQVERAFDNLILCSDAPERDVRFAINCGVNTSKGIHIRTGVIARPKDYAVTVEPVFINSENIGNIAHNDVSQFFFMMDLFRININKMFFI